MLGKAVAEIAKAFRMEVLFSDYKGTTGMGPLYTPFAEVLRRSDIITLHTPLLPSTRNLIAAAEFAAMERHPLLINTARGGLVDEAALYDALISGQIAGAGFDVVTSEPPPADHIMMKLLALPNFILTPHVAWASREAIQSLADQLVDNIEAFERGSATECGDGLILTRRSRRGRSTKWLAPQSSGLPARASEPLPSGFRLSARACLAAGRSRTSGLRRGATGQPGILAPIAITDCPTLSRLTPGLIRKSAPSGRVWPPSTMIVVPVM